MLDPQRLVDIDRNLNTETYLVSKVQKIAAVPYMVITSDAFKPFVYQKELTSMNVHRLLPTIRNYFNLLYFINKAVSVVVSNDTIGAMIYFLQTHRNADGQYIIPPTKRVYFDLNSKRKDEYPYYLNPSESGQFRDLFFILQNCQKQEVKKMSHVSTCSCNGSPQAPWDPSPSKITIVRF